MCDPGFKQELDQISVQIDFEDELANASQEMEVGELFDRAKEHGDAYYASYYEGFWQGRELLEKYREARRQSIEQKHQELAKRWGLDDL